jgi:hypothetical protein
MPNRGEGGNRLISIEKALLIDLCLGVPLGALWYGEAANSAAVDDAAGPSTFLLRPSQLTFLRDRYRANDPSISPGIRALCEQAASLLNDEDFSVTHKTNEPPSGDMHDYYSIGKYWWPDPSSPETVYVRRDGEMNPESYSDAYDAARFNSFSEAVVVLSLAAYLAEDIAFAARAAQLVRTWFLQPQTRQNPHFEYAQILPGQANVRGTGIVEARRLIYVAEAISLLTHLGALNAQEFADIKQWFASLLNWMATAAAAAKAERSNNNVAFWYEIQCITYALFTGNERLARRRLDEAVPSLMAKQIAEDGALPSELLRARPYDYSAFTLVAMAELGRAAETVGIEMWEEEKAGGRSFSAALGWLRDITKTREIEYALVRLAPSTKTRSFASREAEDHLLDLAISIKSLELVCVHHAARDAQLHRLRLDIEERDKRIEVLDAQVKQLKQLKLDPKERHQATRDAQLHKLCLDIGERAKQLEKLHLDLKERNARIDALNLKVAQLSHLRLALSERNEKIRALKLEVKALKRQMENVHSSWSMRLTHPLRLAKQFQKRFAPAANYALRMPGTKVKPVEAPALDSERPKLARVKPDIETLKAEYAEKALNKPDTFVLYRIIGNDLYPRHKRGQSFDNLSFILENEKDFDCCEKRWVVNRIVDSTEEARILQLLKEYHQSYMQIPFVPREYRSLGFETDLLPQPGYLASEAFEQWGAAPHRKHHRDRVITATYRLKNNYVMNINSARNAALREGKQRAKWILPWDGNCFLTESAWERLWEDVTTKPWFKYFAVPMARVIDNALLLTDDFKANPVEEPQLIFRCDSDEEFNESFCYGRRPKVELFWRLGIPGPWASWTDDPWDPKRRPEAVEAHQYGFAGWVARLYSGAENLEHDTLESWNERGRVRQLAVLAKLREIDRRLAGKSANPSTLLSFVEDTLDQEVANFRGRDDPALNSLVKKLIDDADEALTRGPYSVTDKVTLPPSGDRHDYWHPAPYWWPNPETINGLPYIRRDGERVPGTRMYEPESNNYDRTRLQLLFDDSMILALAWKFSGRKQYAEQALKHLKCFFVDPATRMNPHLNYAQVRMGHGGNVGTHYGIIEMKDLYYYLDAIRLLVLAMPEEIAALQEFKAWLSNYLQWLSHSQQGKDELKSTNNHGTYYDLQVASIGAFLADETLIYETLIRSQSRIAQQFAADGSQPHELQRTNSAHYCCFNLQGWIYLAEIASRWGVDLWAYESPHGASLIKGATWLASQARNWPHQQIDQFDVDRYYPIWCATSCHVADVKFCGGNRHLLKPIFSPDDGIRPYWNLGSVGALADKPELVSVSPFSGSNVFSTASSASG